MKANRILAATLATVTVLTALPSVTFAATTESSWSYSYDQATRTLTISGSGDMDDYSYYTYNQNPLYSYKNMVENIVVEGVSSIGDQSFAYFTKAKTVTIDDTVTEIGKDALLGKNKVKTVVIKSSKLLSIGSKAFKGIKKTATIKVANKKLVTAYKKALSTSNGFKSTMTIKK